MVGNAFPTLFVVVSFLIIMSKEKKRFQRRGYLQYIRQNAAGEYVYTGGYHHLQNGTYGELLRRLYAFAVPPAVCAAAVGFLPDDAMMNTFYVLIPYVFLVCFTVSVIWALVRFSANEKPLREYIYKAAVTPIPRRAVAAAVSAGAAAVGHTVFMCLHADELAHLWADVLFYVLLACAAAGMLLARRAAKKARWRFSPAKTDTDNLG